LHSHFVRGVEQAFYGSVLAEPHPNFAPFHFAKLLLSRNIVQNRSLRSLFAQWAAVLAVGSAARSARDIAQLRHILNVFQKMNFLQATSDMPPPIK
jgi:hypothetical protein